MCEKGTSKISLMQQAKEYKNIFKSVFEKDYDYKKNWRKDSAKLGISADSDATSIVDIIDSITFDGLSRKIIELYTTFERFERASHCLVLVEPSEEMLKHIIGCIKKDLKLIFLKESIDILSKILNNSTSKNIRDDNLVDSLYDESLLHSINDFKKAHMDYLRNYANVSVDESAYSKFLSDDEVELLLQKIPRISFVNYFGIIEKNYEKYQLASHKDSFKITTNYSNKLKFIKSQQRTNRESINHNIVVTELQHFKNQLQFLRDYDFGSIETNKSLTFYLMNAENRLADIVAMVHFLELDRPMWFGEDQIKIHKARNEFKELDVKSLAEEVDLQSFQSLDEFFSKIKDDLESQLSRLNVGDIDLFCTEISLLEYDAVSDEDGVYYSEANLLRKVLFSILKTYVYEIYQKNKKIKGKDRLYLEIYSQLKYEELLLDELDTIIAIIDVIEKNSLDLYYKIRSIMYNRNFLRKQRS